MRSHSQTARARIRRMQLERIDMTDRNKLDQIVETPIATVEAILSLPPPGPSPILRGTAGKYLNDALASIAGYRGAPIRRMKNLLSKLCTPGIPYPCADLPPKGIDEEVIDLADYALERQIPYLKTHEAQALARRLLALFQKYSIGPSQAKKQLNTLAKFVPDYIEPPDLFAQFQEHQTLAEQPQSFIKMPPAGHA